MEARVAANTSIEWTDRTWNPVRGCSRVSPGCESCYAERVAARFSGPGLPYEGLARIGKNGPRWTGKVRLIESALGEPLAWRKPCRIFVNSMSDLFHESLQPREVARVFGVMAMASKHTFQVLTKRAARMREMLDHTTYTGALFYDALESMTSRWPLPNVWLGVSVEDQQRADERIPELLATPAAVRFLSCEPLLGPLNLLEWIGEKIEVVGGAGYPDVEKPIGHQLHWVIVGGESGPGARQCDVEWVRAIVRHCRKESTPCFVKQLGAHVIDRNDVGFEADLEVYSDTGKPTNERGWPSHVGVEEDPNGYREEYQGAPVWVRLRDHKGGDMDEWPLELRVREFPDVRS